MAKPGVFCYHQPMIRNILKEEIKKAFKNLDFIEEEGDKYDFTEKKFDKILILENKKPWDQYGDFSTSICIQYFKQDSIKAGIRHLEQVASSSYTTDAGSFVFKNSREFAEKIAEKIREAGNPDILRVEVAGPGFINFFLSPTFFAKNIQEIIETGDSYGNTNLLGAPASAEATARRRKVMVEYTDPNPFKEFHIGHLMSNAVGETLSRIIEANGAEVKRACYQGDVGLHVAKAIWGARFHPEGELNTPYPIKDYPAAFSWGRAYARGAKAFDEDEEAKKQIIEINHKIYSREDQEINNIYDTGRKVCLEMFELDYKRIGTFHDKARDKAFDYYFFESETGQKGKAIVEAGLEKGIFEKSDGAVVFKAEKYDDKLHTRVFLNSAGLPTYEAKELGLAKKKAETGDFNQLVSVTGNEINAYFSVVLEAMRQVMPEIAEKIVHVSHGMLRLPSGKMSSRTGDVITAESLIEEVKEKVRAKISERELSDDKKEKIAEAVAIGAIKYSILKQSPGRDIIFDFDKSLSFEGDSGPYLQYAYTRALSVLEKAQKEASPRELGEGGLDSFSKAKSVRRGTLPGRVPLLTGISSVERLLYRFPEIIERAYLELAPQHIVTYLIELAGAFNSYYAKYQILGSEGEKYRLALTKAVATVLKNGLQILAIPVLEKM